MKAAAMQPLFASLPLIMGEIMFYQTIFTKTRILLLLIFSGLILTTGAPTVRAEGGAGWPTKHLQRQTHILVKLQEDEAPPLAWNWEPLGHAWFVVPIAGGQTPMEAIVAWMAVDGVQQAQPIYTYHLTDPTPTLLTQPEAANLTPNDPLYHYQWNFPQLQTEEAWDITQGQGVIVAVLDTGVARGEDLRCRPFVDPYNAITNQTGENAVVDQMGHGTHVAGTIAQCTDNGIGVAGIAPQVTLLPVQVLDENGSGSSLDVGEGLRWAVDHGAQVINMSMGMDCQDKTYDACHDFYIDDAIAYAVDHDVVIIAAAGNDARQTPSYPANHPDVLGVMATDYNQQLTWYSNMGGDIAAPGGDGSQDANHDGYGDAILQETFGEDGWGYYWWQGTSMAAPHVSGAAALLRAFRPDASRETIIEALEQSARDLGAAGWDTTYGYGLVQIADALYYLGAQRTAPTPTPTPTFTPSPTPTATATPNPTATPTPTAPAPNCPYDMNVDRLVDIEDINLVIMHSEFKSAPYDPFYDINHDQVVDIVDITLVANHFGDTCP